MLVFIGEKVTQDIYSAAKNKLSCFHMKACPNG